MPHSKHTLPFLSALKKYQEENVYPFHTPGHKGGRGILPEFRELLTSPLEIDVSLMNELDDLHCPQGALLEAQEAAARLYRAEKTFFSVNGTSGALQAMLLGSLSPGDKLLLPRNAHRSVISALILSGACPVYVMPEFDTSFGIYTQPTVETIDKTLEQEHAVKAVLVTSPNYYGIAASLPEIAQITHKHDALFLVDEAHGAHLGFTQKTPLPSLSAGADASAQSTHKLLGALTQASLLHLHGSKIDKEKIAQAMSILTTTSPSQLLLASLDAACHQLAEHGEAMLEKAVALAVYMREAIARIDNLRILDLPGTIGGYPRLDPTKVTVNLSRLGVSGFVAADFLRERKIAVELADEANILYIITHADEKAAIDANIAALQELSQTKKTQQPVDLMLPLPLPELVLTPRQAFYGRSENVPLSDAAGRIAAREITFYPPGIPLLLPGELISGQTIKYMEEQARSRNAAVFKYISVVR